MSDANRRQMQQVVNSLWQTLTEAVSASRGIPVERLNAVADRLEVTCGKRRCATALWTV